MRTPLVLYSTNTPLAFHVAEQYYRGKHYVWRTPYFNGRSDKGDSGFVPPTSCPSEIYRSLYGEWRAGDRISAKIEQNRKGIMEGAKAKSEAISLKQEQEIGTVVKLAQIQDFEPVVYVMPYEKVAKLIMAVPPPCPGYRRGD